MIGWGCGDRMGWGAISIPTPLLSRLLFTCLLFHLEKIHELGVFLQHVLLMVTETPGTNIGRGKNLSILASWWSGVYPSPVAKDYQTTLY